ncbi:transposase family protein [Streptomyces sp. NPDC088560]|uniref:transposase family protein n=1 Tax=Streptomyces sp. NPDC088560 TaxID=3365868 RepID=UPI003824FC35
MLVCPSGVDVSASTLRCLSACLRRRRRERGTRWRRASVGRQALLVLAHLRSGHTNARLAAGLGVGTTTAVRYTAEAIGVLAARAPTLAEAMKTVSTKAFEIPDGTPLPVDHAAADRPFHSGRHKKHRMNVQVITYPAGRLPWASPAPSGAVHDIIDAPQTTAVERRADKGYRGAGGTIGVPCRRRRETLAAGQQAVNRSHAKIHAPTEQAMTTLKTWRLPRKQRCPTTRITNVVQAIPNPAPDLPKLRLEKAQ